jgi:nitrate/TMAO reductase-like tetraheme cytochrome c subunit
VSRRRQELIVFILFTVFVEVWGTIFGTINTREKFLDKRCQLAEHEWARLKADNSLEFRNCHDFEYMNFTRQSVRAAQEHSTYLANGIRPVSIATKRSFISAPT